MSEKIIKKDLFTLKPFTKIFFFFEIYKFYKQLKYYLILFEGRRECNK